MNIVLEVCLCKFLSRNRTSLLVLETSLMNQVFGFELDI